LGGNLDCESEASEPNLAVGIDEDIGWFDVFMYQVAGVGLPQRSRKTNRDSEKLFHFKGLSQQAIERRAAGIAEDQHRLPSMAFERQRAGCPGGIEFGREYILMLEPLAVRLFGVGVFRAEDEDRIAAVGPPSAVKDEFTVYMERLQCVSGEIKAGVHNLPALSNRFDGQIFTRYQRQLRLMPYSAGRPLYRTTVS